MALAIRAEILDGALAVVVDRSRKALAVWKGRDHIDLYDPTGTWHAVAHRPPQESSANWERKAVIAHSAFALETSGPTGALRARPSSTVATPPPEDTRSSESTVHVAVDRLERAWLLRARPWGYAVWDGGGSIDVYGAEGGHRREVQVSPADLATLSHLMLDQLAHMRRHEVAVSSKG